jgi:hypothetical protein
MKKYLHRLFLFTLPFLVVFLFIAIIDPYEYINVLHVVDTETKVRVLQRSDESSPRGNLLWKCLRFQRNPARKVIIGDSQGSRFDSRQISELSGDEYFNFCIPGASYETIFDVFDFITANQNDLETVYMAVSFMNFNVSRSYNIFHYGIDYIEKPYLYFMSKDILADTYVNLMYSVTGNPNLVQRSYAYMDPALVDTKMAATLDMFFGDYGYPDNYCRGLEAIVEYCSEKNIDLHFIILPTYKAVDEYLATHDLLDEEQRFKEFIKSLAPTHDYNVPNKYSANRTCFVDYFHLRQEYIDEISQQIWTR